MKKLLEYRVFDLLKNPENEKFLSKVKKENPDLYMQFLNIVGNKGLEVAKQKYQYHDPDVKKEREKKEKEEKALKKKLGNKKYKEDQIKSYLDSYKKEIDEYETALIFSPLHTLANKIKSDDRISEYLESCRAKKSYKNKFKELLKQPRYLSYRFDSRLNLDSLSFYAKNYSYQDGQDLTNSIIRIEHFYKKDTKESTFDVYFRLFDNEWDSYFLPRIDGKKESVFLRQRNEQAQKLDKTNIGEKELYDIIFNKFSVLLDDRVYQRWHKEWELRQNANKYNL